MNKKVVHVVYECTPGNFAGGVQKVAFELALAQKVYGLNVEVWTLSRDGNCGEIISQDLKIRYFSGKRIAGICYSSEIIKALEAERKEIWCVHGHNTFHLLNHQISKFCNRHSIFSFFHPHGALDTELLKEFSLRSLKKKIYINFFERPLLNRAKYVFALTDKEKEQLEFLGVKNNVKILPNGVLGVQENYFKEISSFTEECLTFLYVGRINPKKGLIEFLYAFKNIISIYPKAKFVIAGRRDQFPDYTNKLDTIIDELGISSNINWYGFVNEEKKPELFKSADIFIHTSFSEGMPMAVLEAMSYGLPCLVTKGCYMHKASKSQAVLEVEQGENDITKGLIKLIESSVLRSELSENSIEYIKQYHLWSSIALRTAHYYGLD